jgi:hypothetical protein
MSGTSHISEVMAGLVGEWQASRESLRETERGAHPDLTDVFGRVWTWISGDLYQHDSMTWTSAMVGSPSLRGPSSDALASPNYTWCTRCREVAQR